MSILLNVKKSSIDPYRVSRLKIFLRKIYALSFILAVPFTMLQEIFINMSASTTQGPLNLGEALEDILNPSLMYHYIMTSVCFFLGIQFFTGPIKKYLLTGKKYELAIKRFNSPLSMVMISIISANLILLISYIFNPNYYQHISFELWIIHSVYRLMWQILTGYIMAYGIIEANIVIHEFFTKEDPSAETDVFYDRYKIPILYLIMLILLILSMIKHIMVLNSISEYTSDLTLINNAIRYNNTNMFLIITSVLFIIYLYIGLITSIKQKVYSFLSKSLYEGLGLEDFFYQEKNYAGALVYALNCFFHYLFNHFTTMFNRINNMINKRKDLSGEISEFKDTVYSQLISFVDVSVTEKAISKNMNNLVTYLDKQKIIFSNINNDIGELHLSSQNISKSFTQINQEHVQSLLSTEETISSVEGFINTSDSIKEKINDIFAIIEDSAIETNNINEILNIIKNIAEQTKLLSISASIEAAHGGSSSSDFSSVAEEIRVLADMSHDSVNNIALRVSAIRHFIDNSITLSIENLELLNTNIRDTVLTSDNLKNSVQQIQLLNHNINTFADKIGINITSLEHAAISSDSITSLISMLHNDLKNNTNLSVNVSRELSLYKGFIQNNHDIVDDLDKIQNQWAIKEFEISQTMKSLIKTK